MTITTSIVWKSLSKTDVVLPSVGIIILTSFLIFACTKEEKPTRSECIVAFQLDWSAVKNPNSVRNAMSGPPPEASSANLWAAQFFSMDGSKLYIQYKDHCGKKVEMSDAQIRYWQAQGMNLPKITRIEKATMPSPLTIDVKGPAWSD